MAPRLEIVTYVPDRHRAFESREVEQTLAGADYTPTPDEIALFSSALQLLEEAGPMPGVMTTANDQLVSLIQTTLAVQGAKEGRFSPSANNTREVRFDEHDILRWAGSVFTWIKGIRKFEWQPAGEPATIPSQYRVAILGDWGTGLYGAPVCAETIERMAHDPAKRANMVLHLGDVYYSGTDEEVESRFLASWPTVPGAINRALNGNHEMYTGGHAYYKRILKSTKFDQPSSYFALQNDHWILAGLDTAYADHDLHGAQGEWITALAAGLGGRRLVLFSHHQPFSLLDKQGPNLVRKLATLVDRKQIHAWYWGHEHHCVLYEKHPLWGLYGRCIGHSGYPYFRDRKLGAPPAKPAWVKLAGKNLVPGARLLDGVNPHIQDHPDRYGPNGFVTLEFDGPELFESVHDADGTVLWNQPVADK
jgi:hypothetical protein